MSPRSLGSAPSNQPAPTGLCQLKIGQVDNVITYNNTVTPRIIHDGTGAPMSISITPPYSGHWLITAQNIWLTPDAAWCYFHWGVVLSPADLDGFADDRNHCALHSALTWHESVVYTAYRLAAGVTYTASMYWYQASSGFNQQVWSGPGYMHLMGEFV